MRFVFQNDILKKNDKNSDALDSRKEIHRNVGNGQEEINGVQPEE